LSFLLDAAIYHGLSQVNVPTAFRRPFAGPPPPGATKAQCLAQVDSLIVRGDFLGAAHLAAICLTSAVIQPTDHHAIFRLLAVRYSCLELLGQLLFAAQEAKALEDLSSEFYYDVLQVTDAEIEAHGSQKPLARHIMPFLFRVQAVRLQNIGFSDPRRGVTMLYDLGLEAREHIASPYTGEPERATWVERLESLSMHVVNALIELGDLDCAQRTLSQARPEQPEAQARWASRMVLLLIKLGKVDKAREPLETLLDDSEGKTLLSSILALADGNVEESAVILENVSGQSEDTDMAALIKQNLAVSYLYLGRIAEARKLLEGLVSDGHSFPSLTINLTTMFDLTSDKSREQKLQLIGKLATREQKRPFTNADFKL